MRATETMEESADLASVRGLLRELEDATANAATEAENFIEDHKLLVVASALLLGIAIGAAWRSGK